ncbi:MAG TPA: bifunctional 3,4-dihydroxy-2-butanone-4-phosphate synthase/GTP cyclohydrolase II [Tepidimicrobium sp.]|nr:bifunctional 3,4-dihydroxy-2-butanone-4-phosphate synthase/GTP cyclohydrolase II [Tepidimicrobium sp.]
MAKFNTIKEAIQDIRDGKFVIVVDDADRENEGDLVIAAEKITDEKVNFMIKYARGLVCMPIVEERLQELNIEQMVDVNTDKYGTAFAVSIDYKDTTTGISAVERALTIKKVLDPRVNGDDFKRPGHIFPLKGQKGGVLKRAGHTEAAIDLARLAGLYPAGVICEIIDDDGTMARTPQLMKFAKKHGIKIITIADLIAYRRRNEVLITRVAETSLPTDYGDFKIVGYLNNINGEHHVALVKGKIDGNEPTLVRVHSECLTGDVFHSQRCDCGDQLSEAMRRIEEKGKGIVLYMRQEGRGIGLIDKLKAYELQEKGMDTVEANLALGYPDDLRDYGIGAQILADLGVRKIELMTNNPKKIHGLSGYGLEVVRRIPIEITPNEKDYFYLKTKKNKMGHMLNIK